MNNIQSSLPNSERAIGYLGLYGVAAGATIIFIFPNFKALGALIIFLGFLNWVFAFMRAKALDKLIAENDAITRWTYDSKLWQKYLDTAPNLSKNAKLIVLGGTVLLTLIGLLAIIFDYHFGFDKEELMVYTTISGFVSFGVFLFFMIPNPQQQTKTGRVLFMPKSLYIEGVYHDWQQSDLKLEEFSYNLETQTINFVLTKPQNNGYKYTYINLPVPPNEEESMAIILETYKMYMKN